MEFKYLIKDNGQLKEVTLTELKNKIKELSKGKFGFFVVENYYNVGITLTQKKVDNVLYSIYEFEQTINDELELTL
jgi:hypothetical protein